MYFVSWISNEMHVFFDNVRHEGILLDGAAKNFCQMLEEARNGCWGESTYYTTSFDAIKSNTIYIPIRAFKDVFCETITTHCLKLPPTAQPFGVNAQITRDNLINRVDFPLISFILSKCGVTKYSPT